MGGVGIGREYRRRRKTPSGQRLVGTLSLLFISVYRLVHDHAVPWRVAPLLAGPCVLLLARLTLYMRRGRTLVGPHGVTARRALTERTRAWPDVYDIRVEHIPKAPAHARKWITYLYGTDGGRFVLPHLDDWQLDDPRAEVAALREDAARYRGMAWERRPEVEERIRRRTGHRKAWEQATTGAAIVFGCMFLLCLVLVFTTYHPSVPLLLLWIPLASFALLAALLHWRWASRVSAAAE
ncbi:PH domain-containing protein [Streptomyces sp. NPDC058964]|uniref:PH domain-containing protein n=1 Tax=Streptomyces sp. NPDC058964 TaxID=3346681 RepID=UPI0036CFD136